MWNMINQKIGKNSKKKNNINYIIENNKKISDSKEIAEHFNKHFCNTGKKLSDKIRPPINEVIKLPSMNSKSIFFQPTNQNEIKNIINNMEKNGENDNINAKTLTTLVEFLVDPLRVYVRRELMFTILYARVWVWVLDVDVEYGMCDMRERESRPQAVSVSRNKAVSS